LQQSNFVNELSLSGTDAALFVSDVHLCDDEPAIAAYFFDKLQHWLPQHNHLVILGDLFESWCGDDAADTVAKELIAMLNARGKAGLKIFVMRGNRDFLIDQSPSNADSNKAWKFDRLTSQMAATLLADECILNSFGERWLLCHGDQLCTLDVAYQTFRTQSRSEQWQQTFLSMPKDTRLDQAKKMRAASRAHQQHGDGLAMYDVEQQSVMSLMSKFGATHLLHGHTHRPAVHQISSTSQRWVLSDWATNPARGDAISFSASGKKRLT
jgi:UDP-2,3-diacylglucosamine hydrolase